MVKKYISYLLIGVLFGIVMTKSEAISWFRIQEMFRFQSFHMYGIMGTAVVLGVIVTALIKKFEMRTTQGSRIMFSPKQMSITRYLVGGIIFGLGWALSGACPGPMYTLVGAGIPIFLVVIASAVLGTMVYGAVRSKLPH